MSNQKMMSGKKGIILGVANEYSLAWGIAKKIAEEGAEIAFAYQGPVLEKGSGLLPSLWDLNIFLNVM